MDGIHDLGGMHGFGPIPIESQDYRFKHGWQRRAFGIVQAVAGNTPYVADQHRYKIEQLSATDYLTLDYFEKWITATSALLKDARLVNDQELATGQKEFDVDLVNHPAVSTDDLLDAMKIGADYEFPTNSQPQSFAIGTRVRARSDSPQGHTRVPRYVRGKFGTVLATESVFQHADSVAAGQGRNPQHCYLVSFSAAELWGSSVEQAEDNILLNLAESYLEPM
ncbi:nitrile hydratase subunit beta [Epibacterium ulvae]|uniref:nitrile hydratase subunit beta n=1 Tax=Epibacterium ulvae TaxID=1156985 RepID=UPI0024920B91|nr:nitrile hydratase subunit beta [Epibacterium ulvae]